MQNTLDFVGSITKSRVIMDAHVQITAENKYIYVVKGKVWAAIMRRERRGMSTWDENPIIYLIGVIL